MLSAKSTLKNGEVVKMGKENIGMEPEDHNETLKQDEKVVSSTDNEEKDAKDIHEETEEEEKTLEELKEENKILSDKHQQAIWLPGNHDDLLLMKKHLSDFPYSPIYQDKHWAILMLDSSVAGQPGGEISSQQLVQLEINLERLKDMHILVAMHHSPVSVNSRWLDEHQISNHQKLHHLLAAHGNVKAVITGHIHQQYEINWRGIQVYSTPSTCFQFQENSDQFALSNKDPAYRWLDLHPDGLIETGIKRVDFLKG